MRTLLCVFLTVAMCIILGCNIYEFFPKSKTPEEDLLYNDIELGGVYYIKLNSIGCFQSNDLEMTKSADFETIDNLIKAKRCFVIPTDTVVLIKERTTIDIVNVKRKGSTESFYTVKSNLLAH